MKSIPEVDWNKLMALAGQLEKQLRKTGLIGGQISQSLAFKRFGRDRVMRWRQTGKVNPNKQGMRIYYDLDDLIELSTQNQIL
jgi:hypothetical protein